MRAWPSFAVIFDLDGVIVSTDTFHRQGWQRLAEELGIPFTEDQARRTRGVDRMASLRVVLGPDHGYSESPMEALCLGREPVTLTAPGETRETKRGRAGGKSVNRA
jgi:beta-phosphoglucomutase-like phosphatase (HAD superfamily)